MRAAAPEFSLVDAEAQLAAWMLLGGGATVAVYFEERRINDTLRHARGGRRKPCPPVL